MRLRSASGDKAPFRFARAIAGTRLPNGDPFTAATILDPERETLNGWRPEKGLGGAGRARQKLASSADDFAVGVLKLVGLREGALSTTGSRATS